MLKKIITGCFLFVIACSTATSVLAAGAEVHGFVASNFGQENTGVKDTSAYLKNSYLGVFDVSATSEKFFAGAELNVLPVTGNPSLDVCRIRAGWNVTETFSLTAGEIDPSSALGFARTGGTWVPFTLAAYWSPAEYAQSKGNGLHANYKPTETVNITLGLLDQDIIAKTDQGKGSGSHASVEASFNPVTLRLAYLSGTQEDPAVKDSTNDGVSSNASLVGVKVDLGESFAIALDYSTKTKGVSKKVNEVSTSMAIQVVGKKLGPGDLRLTYASETIDPDDTKDDDASTNVFTNLAYDFEVGDPSGKVQLLYLSKTNTPEKAGDSVTESFVGIGLVKFF